MSRAVEHVFREGARAAVPAAVFSGLPSTVYAFITRNDPLDASVAAGSILLPTERRRLPLLAAAVPVHLSLSAIWGVVLAAVLPRKNPVVEGAISGLVIAAFDLGIIGRKFPRIRALDVPPQVADHVAFGVITAISLSRPRRQS
jgi:hypothetical protein